jgi:hypothetical protein
MNMIKSIFVLVLLVFALTACGALPELSENPSGTSADVSESLDSFPPGMTDDFEGKEDLSQGDDTVIAPLPVESPPPTPTVVPPPQLPDLPVNVGNSSCPDTKPSMLMPGRQGRVSNASADPNRVRDAAGSAGKIIGQIPAGAYFDVLAGPECVEEAAWFQVRYNDLEGWMKEGSATEYWVMPIQTYAQMVQGNEIGLPGINLFLAPEFGEQAQVQNLAFSPENRTPPVTLVNLSRAQGYDLQPWVYVYPVNDHLYYRPERRDILEQVRTAINRTLAADNSDTLRGMTLPALRDTTPTGPIYHIAAGDFGGGAGLGLRAVRALDSSPDAPLYYVFYGFTKDMQHLVYARIPTRLVFGALAQSKVDDFSPKPFDLDRLFGLSVPSGIVQSDPSATGTCPGAPPFQVSVDDWVRVNPEPPVPSRIRANPGRTEVIGQAQPDENLLIIDGPRCANGYTWWKVRNLDGLEGWTIEGDADGYWLIDPISKWTVLPSPVTSTQFTTLDLREIRMTVNTALINSVEKSQIYYLAVPPNPDYLSVISYDRNGWLFSAYSSYTFNRTIRMGEYNIIDIEDGNSRYYLGPDYVAKLRSIISQGETRGAKLSPTVGYSGWGWVPFAFQSNEKVIQFNGGAGVRYIWVGQNASPAYDGLRVFFQGVSDDGRYFIYTSFFVLSEYVIPASMLSDLEKGFGPFVGWEQGDNKATLDSFDKYNARLKLLLEADVLTLYPTLEMLDAMLASIEIKPEKVSWERPPDVCRDNWSRLWPGARAEFIIPFEEGRRRFGSPGFNNPWPDPVKQGDIVTIEKGPVCIDGHVFWLVESKDYGSFWASEGDNNVYWLEPVKDD